MLTAHDLDEAAKIADRILLLAEGRIVADGSPDHPPSSNRTEVTWTVDGQRHLHSTDSPPGT